MNIIIGGSIGSATLTYEVIAVFGYLTFGSKVGLFCLLSTALPHMFHPSKVGANIIAMYPSTSLFIAIGQLAIVVLVLFSYPLQVHPCRNCLDKVFHQGHVQPPAKTITDDNEGENDDEDVDDEHTHAEMSTLKHTLLTSAIIASGFTIAYIVDDLQMGVY
jgi:amino acid permease